MKNKIKQKIPRVVVIGGGTGTFTVLTALRNCRVPLHLTAIVTMADSGGSTGRLRDQYGVLPPGDIRRALVALAGESNDLRDMFNYRFETGSFKGHSFGNLFLTVADKVSPGGFDEGVKKAARALNVAGEVIPVTLDKVTLCARTQKGRLIKGEANIDIRKRNPHIPIEKIWLEPSARINQDARKSILIADIIIIGPGDLYTSLIPNLLVGGVTQAIKKSKAKKVYVCNLMTKYGETHGFRAWNFVEEIEKYLGQGVLDYAVFNKKRPPDSVLRRYREEKAFFVEPSGLDLQRSKPKIILADLLESGRFVRHDSRRKLAKVLVPLLSGSTTK